MRSLLLVGLLVVAGIVTLACGTRQGASSPHLVTTLATAQVETFEGGREGEMADLRQVVGEWRMDMRESGVPGLWFEGHLKIEPGRVTNRVICHFPKKDLMASVALPINLTATRLEVLESGEVPSAQNDADYTCSASFEKGVNDYGVDGKKLVLATTDGRQEYVKE